MLGLRLRLRGGGGADDAKVAAAANLDALADGFGGSSSGPGRCRLPGVWPRCYRPGLSHLARLRGPLGPPHLTDDIRNRLKIIGPFLSRVGRQPDHVPAARRDEPCGVHLAQVPRVRVHVDRQGPEDGRRVLVHVRERVGRRSLARGT